MLKRIAGAAALAGILSGLLLTGLQQWAVAPLIRDAEVREAAAIVAPASTRDSATANHTHAAWSPRSDGERLLATGLANIALATGFALLLAAAQALRGATGWRSGLWWGAAGYAVFFVAPALGLPPELPGAAAAPLRERQLWWFAVVLGTAAGLALIVFGKKPRLRLLGLALLIVPQLLGAPQPELHAATMEPDDVQRFVRATYLCNAVFWLVLGGLLGWINTGERRTI